jgi:S-methylmethionine-dependent homocysteine/selenocysteine methylase
LTDGGLETSLIFNQGFELNHFAAFELLNSENGRAALNEYYRPYLKLADKYRAGFILETPTWRANQDWGAKLGYNREQLSSVNKDSVYFLRELAASLEFDENKLILSGSMGPRGDGYQVALCMSPEEAKRYHLEQIQSFALADVDVVSAITLNYTDEAIGIVEAARSFGIPVVISFTVETDGRLPNGEQLSEAIVRTDTSTDDYTSYYMVNCAHPQHFKHLFEDDRSWKYRIKGIRANASTMSHQELDECETLDAGDKQQLAMEYGAISDLLPELRVIGGCCGTDHSHIESICKWLFSDKEFEV